MISNKIEFCIICGKPILEGKCEFSKPKRGKTRWFHTKCYENLKKKG